MYLYNKKKNKKHKNLRMPESMPSESLPSLSVPNTENLALETDKTWHDMANHSGHDLVNETVDDTPKAEKTFREKL